MPCAVSIFRRADVTIPGNSNQYFLPWFGTGSHHQLYFGRRKGVAAHRRTKDEHGAFEIYGLSSLAFFFLLVKPSVVFYVLARKFYVRLRHHALVIASRDLLVVLRTKIKTCFNLLPKKGWREIEKDAECRW